MCKEAIIIKKNNLIRPFFNTSFTTQSISDINWPKAEILSQIYLKILTILINIKLH